MSVPDIGLAVWLTRMIHIPRGIAARGAIDGGTIFEVKQIARTQSVRVSRRNSRAFVFYDWIPFLNRDARKESKTCPCLGTSQFKSVAFFYGHGFVE